MAKEQECLQKKKKKSCIAVKVTLVYHYCNHNYTCKSNSKIAGPFLALISSKSQGLVCASTSYLLYQLLLSCERQLGCSHLNVFLTRFIKEMTATYSPKVAELKIYIRSIKEKDAITLIQPHSLQCPIYPQIHTHTAYHALPQLEYKLLRAVTTHILLVLILEPSTASGRQYTLNKS